MAIRSINEKDDKCLKCKHPIDDHVNVKHLFVTITDGEPFYEAKSIGCSFPNCKCDDCVFP